MKKFVFAAALVVALGALHADPATAQGCAGGMCALPPRSRRRPAATAAAGRPRRAHDGRHGHDGHVPLLSADGHDATQSPRRLAADARVPGHGWRHGYGQHATATNGK